MLFMNIPSPEKIGGSNIGGAGQLPETNPTGFNACLACALGVLKAAKGVRSEAQKHANSIVTDAEKLSTIDLRTRATIIHCGVPLCKRGILIISDVSDPNIIPDDGNPDIEPLPGTEDCLLAKTEQDIN